MHLIKSKLCLGFSRSAEIWNYEIRNDLSFGNIIVFDVLLVHQIKGTTSSWTTINLWETPGVNKERNEHENEGIRNRTIKTVQVAQEQYDPQITMLQFKLFNFISSLGLEELASLTRLGVEMLISAWALLLKQSLQALFPTKPVKYESQSLDHQSSKRK